MCVCVNVVHMRQLLKISVSLLVWIWVCFENSFLSHICFPGAGLVGVLVLFVERHTSITTSHKSRAGNPSICSPASNEMISDYVEQWDTDVCFLHIPARLETLYTCSVCQFAVCTAALSVCVPIRSISQRIFEHVLPCRKTTQPSLREVFPTLVVFQLLQQTYVIQTFLCITLSTSQKTRNDVGSSRSTTSIKFFYMGAIFRFFPAMLISSTYTDKKNPGFR